MDTTTTDTTTQPSAHPILGFAKALDGALDRVAGVNPIFMSASQKRAALVELTREQARLDALVLRVLAAGDLDDIGTVDGSSSTGAWLGHHIRADRAEVTRAVRLATALETTYYATGVGLGYGEFSTAHAQVIVWALDRLPDDLDAGLVAQAEKVMVDAARQLCPKDLRITGKHLLHVIAPDTYDEELRRQLEAEERRAQRTTHLRLRHNGDGTTCGWFRIPDLHAAILTTALEALTAPRKIADPVDPLTGRRLDHATLMGQGFCELLEHLPTTEFGDHGGTAATVVVTLSHETLTEALGAAGFAELPGGQQISAGEARRLACNAAIIPAVLGGNSSLLDLGRAARLFTRAQRIALGLRDKGCRAETCDRPAPWTEAHHFTQAWAKGGRTDLADGVLLCGYHHRLAHDASYDHHRMPNGDIRFNLRT